MTDPHLFACCLDELTMNFSSGRVERRLEQGQSWTVYLRGWIVLGSDDLRATVGERALDSDDREWLAPSNRIDALMEKARHRSNSIRLLERRTVIDTGEVHRQSEQTTIVINGAGELALVTTPEDLDAALDALGRMEQPDAVVSVDACRGLPWLFRDGAGAVLLHEAVGHPAELGLPVRAVPSWLQVVDNPSKFGNRTSGLDDTATRTTSRVLSAGERPSSQRRRSFRDAPLTRMSNVVVECSGSQSPPSRKRLEVSLVSAGRYDPATDEVTLRISVAHLIEGNERSRLEPFDWHASRSEILNAFRGWSGETRRYRGVICSSEGIELPVGAFSPDLELESLLR